MKEAARNALTEGWGISRTIVECKSAQEGMQVLTENSISRTIVECKLVNG